VGLVGAGAESTPYQGVGAGAAICRAGFGVTEVCPNQVVVCTPATAGKVYALVSVVAKALAFSTMSRGAEA
jgi:hypothetical protein